PMMEGTLNPTEEYSLTVMQAIIQQLVKKTKHGEALRFSVPGALRGGGSPDLVYHEAMLRDLLHQMGYNAKGVNEGLRSSSRSLRKRTSAASASVAAAACA